MKKILLVTDQNNPQVKEYKEAVQRGMRKITIVSLAYNGLEMTQQFLTRLKQHTDIPFDLIFTDNGSQEPIANLVKEHFPDATIIKKDKNVGCPATRNEQMKHVKTKICFWLDNDTMVGPKWYEPILKQLEDPTIGVSGPSGARVTYPWDAGTPFEAVDCMEGLDVDYFVGYLVGFKTEAYKSINDYHLAVNIDDVELCWGIKENGLRAVCSGPCFANHLTSQTERAWWSESPMEDLWNNWPKKKIFEKFK